MGLNLEKTPRNYRRVWVERVNLEYQVRNIRGVLEGLEKKKDLEGKKSSTTSGTEWQSRRPFPDISGNSLVSKSE